MEMVKLEKVVKLEEGGGVCGGWCTGHEALLAVGEVGEPEM